MSDYKARIGIIGKGFVGTAVAHGFSTQTGFGASIKIYDKDPVKSINNLDETVNESDFIFLSVPTPSKKDGSIDLSILKDAIQSIDNVNKSENIILVRSTVVPGTTRDIQKEFPKLNIVFNPEFLTERSAAFDFINQSRVILGGEPENTSRVEELYKKRFGEYLPVLKSNFEKKQTIPLNRKLE